VTIELSVISQLTGIVLGIFAALGRLSTLKIPIFRWIAAIYIWFFRGTPLLVQMAFVYFAIPQITNFNLILDAFVSGFVALSLNEGAYMAEIVRAGILSVDQGQFEAAQSLGMRRSLAMRRIVLPQAIRVIIPPTGNEFISMLKNTSLAYSITAVELFYQGQITYSSGVGLGSQRYFELLAVVSTWYLAMTTVATYFQGHIERYFERGFSRQVSRPGVVRRMFVGMKGQGRIGV
jgi:polar amino acid transport system permease protein